MLPSPGKDDRMGSDYTAPGLRREARAEGARGPFRIFLEACFLGQRQMSSQPVRAPEGAISTPA
eukprot:11201048-Lingulodinium_polyedra.AAC.1